jgi:hypothetical protein
MNPEQTDILDEFFYKTQRPFYKSQMWNGVSIHKQFVGWLRQLRAQGRPEYDDKFPTTKTILIYYMGTTLNLKLKQPYNRFCIKTYQDLKLLNDYFNRFNSVYGQ